MNVKKLGFKQDERLEAYLQEQGLAYAYVDVDLKKIDGSNTTYQTRKDAFGESKDLVAEYCDAMIAGATFPALLLVEFDDGSYAINCGKHRFQGAKKAGFKRFGPVLVVKLTGDDAAQSLQCERLRVISRRDNNDNGWRISRAEVFDGIAGDIVNENGGPDAGIPPRRLVQQICRRHGIENEVPVGVNQRVSAILIQAKCRELNTTPPAELNACHELLQLKQLDGFPEIVKECSKFDGKGLAKTLRHARLQRMNGADAVSHIRDVNSGYGMMKDTKQMTNVDRLRLNIRQTVNLLSAVKADSSLTPEVVLGIEEQAERLTDAINETLMALKSGGAGC